MKKFFLPLIFATSTLALVSCNQKQPGNAAEVQALNDRIRQLEDQEKQLQLQAEKDKLATDRAALEAEKQKLQDEKDAAARTSSQEKSTASSSSIQTDAQDDSDDDDDTVASTDSDSRDETDISEGKSYDVFYERLEDDGRWYNDDTYGYVFQPSVAERDDWRPYTDGRWAYTDRGCTWVSNEKFGWATYHYGRWVRVRGTGWVWVPGRKWAPAWVSWRESGQTDRDGDDYVGWAPLPPECDDRAASVKVEAWSDNYYGVGPAAYVFLKASHFGRPNYRDVVEAPGENVTIINRTTNITRITINKNVVNNYGPEFDDLNRRNNNRLQRYQLDYEPGDRQRGDYRTVAQGNRLQVFAPPAQLRAVSAAAPKNAREIRNAQVERGWQGIDPNQEKQLKQRLQTQPPPKALPPQPVAPRKARIITASTRQPSQPVVQPGQKPGPGQPSVPTGANAAAQRARLEAEKAQLLKQKQALEKVAATPKSPAPVPVEQQRPDIEKQRREMEKQNQSRQEKNPAPPTAATPPQAPKPATPTATSPAQPPPRSSQTLKPGAQRENPPLPAKSPALIPEKKRDEQNQPSPKPLQPHLRRPEPVMDTQAQDARKEAAQRQQEQQQAAAAARENARQKQEQTRQIQQQQAEKARAEASQHQQERAQKAQESARQQSQSSEPPPQARRPEQEPSQDKNPRKDRKKDDDKHAQPAAP